MTNGKLKMIDTWIYLLLCHTLYVYAYTIYAGENDSYEGTNGLDDDACVIDEFCVVYEHKLMKMINIILVISVKHICSLPLMENEITN